MVALTGAIDDLKNSIDDRNKLISECRVQFPAMQEIERISLYVGAPLRGIVDGRFSQNIDALGKQNDDCIFFSKILAEELRTYGNRLRRRNLFRFRIGMQKFLPPDWSMAVQEDLVPNEADYANWLRGFVDRPPWWKRFWRGLRASSSRVFSL